MSLPSVEDISKLVEASFVILFASLLFCPYESFICIRYYGFPIKWQIFEKLHWTYYLTKDKFFFYARYDPLELLYGCMGVQNAGKCKGRLTEHLHTQSLFAVFQAARSHTKRCYRLK